MVASPARSFRVAAQAALFVLVASAVPGHAKCDATTDPDKSDVANARAVVAVNCDCAGASTHGAYVSCAVQQAKPVLVNKSCARSVKKCASRSTCGRRHAVTCCLTTTAGAKCKIKRDAAHCAARQGSVGTCTSCCDAYGSPAGGPGCPLPTTTTTTTTTTSCPPATALYCGREGCGSIAFCPTGMTCTDASEGCTCVGPPIACGDIVSGLSTEQCRWGTCPAGMMCNPVPKQGECGFDCVCQ
jgi:hypothetical protein